MGGSGCFELGVSLDRGQLPAACAALDAHLRIPEHPTDPDDVRTYVDLLRRDAETYFTDVEHYFRCLDQERREVFDQARDVSEGLARVLEFQGRVRE